MENSITLPIQSEVQCDVLVAGGGVAGCSAAIAAARMGCKVILIDECGMVGGQATLGMVAPIAATRDRLGHSFGGIMQEILDKTQAQCVGNNRDDGAYSSPALFGLTLLETLYDVGVQVHVFTTVLTAQRDGRLLHSVIASTKSGLRRYCAKQFIDATGDGDLLFRSGEETVFGSEPGVYQALVDANLANVHYTHDAYAFPAPGAVQPSSVMFSVGGVDEEAVKHYRLKKFTYEDAGMTEAEFEQLPYAGRKGFEKNGDYLPLPQGRFLFFKGARSGVYTINMSRVTRVDGTDADSISAGTVDAQLQVLPVLDLLRRCIPGFEKAYLIQNSMRLGVRESRRMVSRRTLTGAEVIRCARLNDVVAHGSYIIDIHDPDGKSMAIGGEVQGSCYDIPYGALLPKGTDNLFACGRCIGSDHVAHSSTRIIGTCMLTGQAAGTAAAMCVDGAKANGELDVSALQQRLLDNGVRLRIPGKTEFDEDLSALKSDGI